MPRNYKLFLEDILNSTQKILMYVGNNPFESVVNDEMRLDAIIRNFEVIGVAAKNIPPQIREK